MHQYLLFILSNIDGKHLRREIRLNHCCPEMREFNQCCTFENKGKLYFGDSVSNFYADECCDHNLSCKVNLSHCESCKHHSNTCLQSMSLESYTIRNCGDRLTIYPYLPYISHSKVYDFRSVSRLVMKLDDGERFRDIVPLNYQGNVFIQIENHDVKVHTVFENMYTHVCITWDTLMRHQRNWLRIYATVSNSFKKISAIQFTYDGNFTLNTSNTSIETEFAYEYFSHDAMAKTIKFIAKTDNPIPSGPILYIPVQNVSYFNFRNIIVVDDLFPASTYEIKCV